MKYSWTLYLGLLLGCEATLETQAALSRGSGDDGAVPGSAGDGGPPLPPGDGGGVAPTDAPASGDDGSVRPGLDAGGTPAGTPMWVGVGAWGFRAATTDGSNWETLMNPSTGNDHSPDLLRDVAYGDGVFIAVGGDLNSMVMRSVDGTNWEIDLLPTGTQWLGGVAYDHGLWVAGGGVGTVARSTDGGRTWAHVGESAPAAIRDMAGGDGHFVAVGDNGLIAVSEDGTGWTDRSQSGAVRLSHVAQLGGVWVASGSEYNGSGFDTDCFLSTDTITWNPCPFSSGRITGLFATDGRLFASTESGYEVTSDGTTWSTENQAIPDKAFLAGSRWVGASSDRYFWGESLGSLQEGTLARGFRAFTVGWVD